MKASKNTDRIKQELNESNNVYNRNYILIGEYRGIHTITKFKCLKHNYIFETTPHNVIRSRNSCPMCKSDNVQDTFLWNVHLLFKGLIIPLDRYNGIRTRIKVKCTKHNKMFLSKPVLLYKGHNNCPICQKEKRAKKSKSEKTFLEEFHKIYKGNLIPLERYKGIKEKIKIYCPYHDLVFKITPDHLLNNPGMGCPKCGKHVQSYHETLSTQQFKAKLKETTNNEYLLVGEYINSRTKVKLKHIACGHTFTVLPACFINTMGTSCPYCHQSKGERLIQRYLIKHKIPYVWQKKFKGCKDKKELPFDFYVNNRIIIEFDGEQHFKPVGYHGGLNKLKYTQKHDKIKDEFCKSNNIPIERIPYTKLACIDKVLDAILDNKTSR